jgi:hypothetical protein
MKLTLFRFQWVDLDVPSVSHTRWSCLSAEQKSARVFEVTANLLSEH